MNNNKNMKSIIKIITVFAFVFGLVGCEEYEDYVKDYDYTGVYFAAQQPLRTLVSRTGKDYLEFKIGVTLAGVRENTKGYSATFEIDPELLETMMPAPVAPNPPVPFTLLPEDWYTIDHNNWTFVVPVGKFLGDCSVKIDKKKFTDDPNALKNTYALPLRLLSTTADSLVTGMDYTVIVIKYIDEHSGNYYCTGTQEDWDGAAIVQETDSVYYHVDLSRNKIRTLTTVSLTQFDMAGMGIRTGTAAVDHLLINLVEGAVTLETKPGCNVIEDKGSSYNAETKTFYLNYVYTKGGRSCLVHNEALTLRQDPEEELRFDTW